MSCVEARKGVKALLSKMVKEKILEGIKEVLETIGLDERKAY